MSVQLTKEVMRRSAMFDAYFQKSMDKVEGKHGAKISPEERKKIQKMIVDKQYDLKFPKEHWLKMMMFSLTDTYNIIFQMEWTIFKPPKDKAFITSDNPAYTFNVKPEGFWGSGIGFLAPNCESTAMLTPKVAIFLSQKHNPSVVRSMDVSNDLVKNINFRTAICSTRFIVSNSETLLKRTVERTHLDKRGSYAKVKVG